MTEQAREWYVIKADNGYCAIRPGAEITPEERQANPQVWGPYSSEAEAIAHRVGLIRAQKCKPQ